MKKLDLNAYKVSEMSQQELSNIDGGSIWRWIGKLIEAAGIADALAEFADGFSEGVQEGYAAQQSK